MAVEAHNDYLVRRISDAETIAQLESFPRYFEIETINACNAACPMCTIANWQRTPSVMKDDLFEKIASEIERHPEVKRVHLYRDGEPLLDKKLAKRIARLKSGGIRKVGISTNAELLTDAKAEAILSVGLDEIILSIDSLKKDVYDKIRVGLNFELVKENCLNVFATRNRLGSKCHIRVRMIRQETNNDEWPEFEQFWRPRLSPQDSVEFRIIHNWGGQLDGFKSIAPSDISRPCLALWSLMTIFVDGTVPLCNVDYNAKFPVGNVKDSSIAELWQSHEQNRRRSLHMNNKRGELSPCTNCTVWSEKAA